MESFKTLIDSKDTLNYLEDKFKYFQTDNLWLNFHPIDLLELAVKPNVVDYLGIPFAYLVKLICNPQIPWGF